MSSTRCSISHPLVSIYRHSSRVGSPLPSRWWRIMAYNTFQRISSAAPTSIQILSCTIKNPRVQTRPLPQAANIVPSTSSPPQVNNRPIWSHSANSSITPSMAITQTHNYKVRYKELWTTGSTIRRPSCCHRSSVHTISLQADLSSNSSKWYNMSATLIKT